MRSCNPTLAAALVSNIIPFRHAEIYEVTLQNGTIFYWTTYDSNIAFDGNTYTAQGPFLKRSPWRITNTMEIPTMDVTLLALTTSFNGGSDIRSQAIQGLFDGATIVLRYLYIETETGDILGDISDIFGGIVGTVDIGGQVLILHVKGANNKLAQNAPRRVYQVQCNNTFCDEGCTLDRTDFTASYVVGSSPAPSRFFIPWDTPPANPEYYQLGTVTMTSGAASGQSMNVDFADSSGLTLSFPLYATPAAGDTFDAFEGCDKTRTTCDRRGNTQNGLWFPYIPPAETAF